MEREVEGKRAGKEGKGGRWIDGLGRVREVFGPLPPLETAIPG